LLVGLWVAGVMLMLPARLGLTLSRRPERWLPLSVAFAVYVLCPHGAFNTLFLFHRLAVFLVPLWLIAWERPADRPATPTRKPLVLILLLTISVWLSLNLARFGMFAEHTRGLTAVLSRMEPEKYVAGMTGFTGTPEFSYPVYLHIAAWYQATRGGIVDFNFAIFHPQLVRYKDMTSPRIDVPRSERPKTFVWDRDGGDRYDYFLVYSEEDVAAELFKDRIDEVELATRDGSWWVYKNLKRWPGPGGASRGPEQGRRDQKAQSF